MASSTNYIVDGYNVGFKIPNAETWLKKGETERAIPIIINFIDSNIPRNVKKIIIVLDGRYGVFQEFTTPGRVRLKFSSKPQTADDIIRRFIRSNVNPKQWTVVSSDHEILFTAKDHGAQTIKSEDFARQKLKDSGNKRAFNEHLEKYDPGDVDVDYWMDIFGADEDDD